MHSEAGISSCGVYRWWLFRKWDSHLPPIIWIMMNPSTADHKKDDPTIRKVIRLSSKWEYGSVIVLNVYAFRSPHPDKLPRDMDEAVGHRNDWWIKTVFEYAAKNKIKVVAAWGVKHGKRGRVVHSLAHDAGLKLRCLEVGLNGEPKHPRFLSEDLRPRRLRVPDYH